MKKLHLAIILIVITITIVVIMEFLIPNSDFTMIVSSNELTVDGLNDTYNVGEMINFKVKFNELIGDCIQPHVVVKNQTNQIIWQSKEIALPCSTDTTLHQGKGEFEFGNSDLGYLRINQTGSYYIHIWFAKEIVEKINIIQPVNNEGNSTMISSEGMSQTHPETNTQVNNSLSKGAQVDLTNVSVWTCGAGRKIATFVDTSGFANITRANGPDKGLPSDWNDFFDFVLKPNSTGYINMSFEFGKENYAVGNGQFNGTIQSSLVYGTSSTVSDLFNKTAIYTLDEPYSSPHIGNLDGISIFATNIDNVTNHTLRLTYVIKIDPSAKEGTFGLDIPYTCPIELLTVGDKPYTDHMPWHRSIY